jgi:uncharacterized OB-fold protein
MTAKSEREILVSGRSFDSIFSYTAGKAGSRFLRELRDNKKILGARCPNCRKVWVPARSTCVHCFTQLEEIEQVGASGIVTTFSVVAISRDNYHLSPPFILGIIQLDGADNGIVHFIGDVDPLNLRIGMKVEAVFNDARIGSILDIKHFRPIEILGS